MKWENVTDSGTKTGKILWSQSRINKRMYWHICRTLDNKWKCCLNEPSARNPKRCIFETEYKTLPSAKKAIEKFIAQQK